MNPATRAWILFGVVVGGLLLALLLGIRYTDARR